MKEVVLSLIAGLVVGLIFKFIRLPIPAPPVLSGIVGIVGIYIGGLLADWLLKAFILKG